MDRLPRMVLIAAVVCFVAVSLGGCGDDDKSTGPQNTLSEQEQFDIIDDLLDLEQTPAALAAEPPIPGPITLEE